MEFFELWGAVVGAATPDYHATPQAEGQIWPLLLASVGFMFLMTSFGRHEGRWFWRPRALCIGWLLILPMYLL